MQIYQLLDVLTKIIEKTDNLIQLKQFMWYTGSKSL